MEEVPTLINSLPDGMAEKIGEAPVTDLGTVVSNLEGLDSAIESFFGDFILAFIVLMVWSIVWKGIALWKAARNGQKPWFIVLLIVNTMGILEILYINFWQKKIKK